MPEERKTESYLLHLTPTEKKQLKEKAEQSKLSISKYLIALSENKKIVSVEKLPLEITRIGVNINQIAHVANSQKYVNTQQIYEIKNLLREVDKHMIEIIKALDNYDEDDVRTLDKKIQTMGNDMSAMEQRMSLLERNFDEAFYRMDMKLDKIISAEQKRVDNNGSS